MTNREWAKFPFQLQSGWAAYSGLMKQRVLVSCFFTRCFCGVWSHRCGLHPRQRPSMCPWTWGESVQRDLEAEHTIPMKPAWRSGPAESRTEGVFFCVLKAVHGHFSVPRRDEPAANTYICSIPGNFIIPKDQSAKPLLANKKAVWTLSIIYLNIWKELLLSLLHCSENCTYGTETNICCWVPTVPWALSEATLKFSPVTQGVRNCYPAFIGKGIGIWGNLLNHPTSPHWRILGWNSNPVCLA